jgi:hypothetical protein
MYVIITETKMNESFDNVSISKRNNWLIPNLGNTEANERNNFKQGIQTGLFLNLAMLKQIDSLIKLENIETNEPVLW